MSKGKTSIYATFCISVNHLQGYMDENAVKAILAEGQRAMANETLCLCSVVPDRGEETSPHSVAVKVTEMRIEGKTGKPSDFGTDDVPLKMHCQTEYQP